MWMNEYEIDDAGRWVDADETPNLDRAVKVLTRLRDWTNNNSDGWPYWRKPSAAASRLMDMIDTKTRATFRGAEVHDLTEAEMTAALRPVKAFLTRQHVSHDLILGEPKEK